MMSNAHRRKAYAHKITGSLKPCTLDDPEGQPASGVYNKLLEQQTNITRYLQGAWSAVRVSIAWVTVCAEVQQVEDDDAFCRLIYRFTVNRMILKYQSGRTRTNERHDRGRRKRKEL